MMLLGRVVNISCFQQLEQTILAQQSTPHNQQQQLQQRVQQILQQKQQLQQQIKQFQQQVEQQLAYTQHASPQLLGAGPPPQLTAAGQASGKAAGKEPGESVEGGTEIDGQAAITAVTAQDLNFLMCSDQLQGFIQGPGNTLEHNISITLLTPSSHQVECQQE